MMQALWSRFDWEKHSLSDLTYHLFDMVTFADAWAAIELRWAAEDYSVRWSHPADPNNDKYMTDYQYII